MPNTNNDFDFPIEKVFEVGFYDCGKIFFTIWDRNWGRRGFPELACGVDSYAVRWHSAPVHGEKKISREEVGRILKAVGA